MSETKQHPHAALIEQYARDARKTDKPWEWWQVNAYGEWLADNDCCPSFNENRKYRRTPQWEIEGFKIGDEIQHDGGAISTILSFEADSDNCEIYEVLTTEFKCYNGNFKKYEPPRTPRTIRIGEYDVPMPMTFIKTGEDFYYPAFGGRVVKKKITAYKVLTDEQQQPAPPQPEQMHEKLDRPEILYGSTYKIKSPQNEHALYITINDMMLNEGTEHEQLHPYEIFINSKNMEHFQWVLALTRTISAVWRKGGDCAFLVEELKAVFDPQGGYWKKGGVFMPSLVAEIGSVIEVHLKRIGIIKTEIDQHQKQFLEAKRKEFELR